MCMCMYLLEERREVGRVLYCRQTQLVLGEIRLQKERRPREESAVVAGVAGHAVGVERSEARHIVARRLASALGLLQGVGQGG